MWTVVTMKEQDFVCKVALKHLQTNDLIPNILSFLSERKQVTQARVSRCHGGCIEFLNSFTYQLVNFQKCPIIYPGSFIINMMPSTLTV